MKKVNRLLVTGAAGTIGGLIRDGVSEFAEILRLSDIADLGEARPGEEIMPCDLTDADAVHKLVSGCDAILHFGGISTENRADLIHKVNIEGTYSLYEAARKEGVKRILFASSNHVIGFHKRETRLTASSPIRPDGNYGVSKAYGEALARLYWDKYGIETLIVRIGSCFPAPKDRRMMATWMSAGDMVRLIGRMIDTPRLGCPIVYGVSDNAESWWDNSETDYLGWRPQDSSAQFAGLFDDVPQEDPTDPAVIWQGGMFAKAGHFDD
ncbi:NAD-dependent epimerase/dehydratase family protein [Actibacterium pelagium]|uniref:Uronate dehydrogenase n=1 Tax=Actibacterium pelagium TaxID=2029103 RepID=A0A917ELD9_9RHOB|nr:NAD(P)-dependent oxidoreductase [Actibacterium pelagium]GGE58337.1 uronate dehydrogenase [Actibacterium pelagium]